MELGSGDADFGGGSHEYVPYTGDRAKVIINKRMITPIPGLFASNRPINVSIICYNVGKAPAYTVSIGDNWGELFDITEGSNATMVDVLDVGESVELNFTVVPLREGHFTGGAATVSYQAEGEGSRIQQAYSAGYRSFTVYPTEVYEQYSRSRTFEWTIIGLGSAIAVAVPFAYWAYIQLNYRHGQPKSKSL